MDAQTNAFNRDRFINDLQNIEIAPVGTDWSFSFLTIASLPNSSQSGARFIPRPALNSIHKYRINISPYKYCQVTTTLI
jgi:hypothetical protein